MIKIGQCFTKFADCGLKCEFQIFLTLGQHTFLSNKIDIVFQ